MSKQSTWQRFWQKVAISDECWQWTSATNLAGYGQFRFPAGNEGAHRVAFELWHGQSPGERNVCHSCDNPSCVKPSHLFLGTSKDNRDDMVAKGRGYEGSGHHSARLSEPDVKDIRALHSTGKYTQDELGRLYGVTQGAISAIVKRRTWKRCY